MNNTHSETFYNRYIVENAKQHLGIDMMRFLMFKEGKFINPMKKNEILQQYIKEELDNFYNKKLLNIPEIEFCITTKCTLQYKDCCALIPQLDKTKRSEMNFSDFKLYFDKFSAAVDTIRLLVMIGGEPLMNPELPQMLEYAAENNKIDFIKIITNGTMLPNSNLLNTLKKYNKKIYLYISNYSCNPELKNLIKHEKLLELLDENQIKHQKVDEWVWLEEHGFSKAAFPENITKDKFKNCFRTKCTQIINGKLDICSKATAGRELNMFEDDSIDIINTTNLRNDLIEFYSKEYLKACEYCILCDTKVSPALQINNK